MIDSAKNRKFVVYKHTNKINGKIYIGITCRPVSKRWGAQGQCYKNNAHFYSAIQKYGWDNFEHEILFSDLSLTKASSKEQELVNFYVSYNPKFGYNGTKGGEFAIEFTEETKRKMSESRKGREITDEWRQHLSEAGKGHVPWNKGGRLTQEHKEKLRIASTGRKQSAKAIAKTIEVHSKSVVYDGQIFASIKECGEFLGVDPHSILAPWLRGEYPMPEKYKKRGFGYYGIKAEYIEQKNPKNKGVICEGRYFNSMSECGRFYGIKNNMVSHWLNHRCKMPQEFQDKGLRFSEEKYYYYRVID